MLRKPTHLQEQIIPVRLRGLIVKLRQATLTGTLINQNFFVPVKNVLHPVTNIYKGDMLIDAFCQYRLFVKGIHIRKEQT